MPLRGLVPEQAWLLSLCVERGGGSLVSTRTNIIETAIAVYTIDPMMANVCSFFGAITGLRNVDAKILFHNRYPTSLPFYPHETLVMIISFFVLILKSELFFLS